MTAGGRDELHGFRKIRNMVVMSKRLPPAGGKLSRTAPSGARVVTATETAKNFGAIIDRVREDRAVYVVERSGKPVAEIGPAQVGTCTVRDFAELVRSGSVPVAGDEYLKAVEEGVAFWNREEVPEDPWAR